jgi:CheY-like chemotaxis protein
MSSGVTVLVADDEPDMRLLVRLVLERAGFEVVEEAVDGVSALAAASRLTPPVPTVMVLDNQMPGRTGLEVAERVLAESPRQCIILFSAFLDDNVERRAVQLGIRGCLAKGDVARLPEMIDATVCE